MKKRYFTFEEANLVLSEVERSIFRLMRLQAAIELLDTIEIEYEDEFKETVQEAISGKEFHRLHFQLFREIERLLELGAIPKDLRMGLVDFYGLKDGKEIFLCWKAGESCVEHWHEIDTGFDDRRPMSELFDSDRGVDSDFGGR